MVERSNRPAAIPVSPIAPSPQVTISDDNTRVIATLPAGDRIEVLFYGATVISWKSANGKENLFMSTAAKTDGSKPVRGGIPLVFPVSAYMAEDEESGVFSRPVQRQWNEEMLSTYLRAAMTNFFSNSVIRCSRQVP